MTLSMNLEELVQQQYEKECEAHLKYVSDMLFENKIDGNATLVGLADAFTSIIGKQVELDTITEEDNKFCNEILSMVQAKGDTVRTLALINKLCTEMLCKSMIAKEIAANEEVNNEVNKMVGGK